MTTEARKKARAERLAYEREIAAARAKAGLKQHAESSSAAKRDGERLLALVPEDTRDLTARAFGDPLPGRSALDRKQERAA